MTWLYLPSEAIPESQPRASTSSRSDRAPAVSTSDSPSPSPDIELWAISNGKPTPRPFSWRGWKTRPWIRLRSGTMLPSSTAALGAARWTSSLRAIRASRSPSRASTGAPTALSVRSSALRLPRECCPSSPPRLPRSPRWTGRHGLPPCSRPLYGVGNLRHFNARSLRQPAVPSHYMCRGTHHS